MNNVINSAVYVYTFDLSKEGSRQELYETFLSADELSRASRFHFALHRNRYIRARGILRELLGERIDTGPGAIQFKYNAYGKPELFLTHASELRFNISHSENILAVAITENACFEIGLDIEKVRPLDNIQEIERGLLTDCTIIQSQKLQADARCMRFFQAWTCKEAYLKATGRGLIDSDKVKVSFSTDQKPVLHADERNLTNQHWILLPEISHMGVAGAVVILVDYASTASHPVLAPITGTACS